VLDDPYLNVLPLFTKDTPNIKTRARNLDAESQAEKDHYIMALPQDKRRAQGSPAVVQSLQEFRHNFNVFCESSLVDIDWDNIVAAGSSAVNCLLPVPAEYNTSKRALRQYCKCLFPRYDIFKNRCPTSVSMELRLISSDHEKFAPASDIDLFLYGLDEQQAIEKIKQIETRVRDSILSEVTVVRTKNAITICSQYPTRHIQVRMISLRDITSSNAYSIQDCSPRLQECIRDPDRFRY
jgi:hypothetical protein